MNLFFFFFFYTFLCLGLLRLSKPPLFSSTFITLVVVVFWILAKIWSLVLETLTGILFKSLICICCCNCSGTPRKKKWKFINFFKMKRFYIFFICTDNFTRILNLRPKYLFLCTCGRTIGTSWGSRVGINCTSGSNSASTGSSTIFVLLYDPHVFNLFGNVSHFGSSRTIWPVVVQFKGKHWFHVKKNNE